ncbi:hypothetical protein GOODEAATRI_033332, partial [Goodea atripinnis]
YVTREGHVELRPHTARLLSCRDEITQKYHCLKQIVVCYNQVQCFSFTVPAADAEEDKEDSLLESKVKDQTCRNIKTDGEQLLRLTQVLLQQNPELCTREQEVMGRLLQVKEEAEQLRAGLNRYSHLWQSDRTAVFQEFLTYGKQLGAEAVDAERKPPTLKDFQREVAHLYTPIQVLLTLSSEVSQLDEVILLNGWLQVDMRPFKTCLLSIILDWKHMYTHRLLESATNR